jgi:hypothetical protein
MATLKLKLKSKLEPKSKPLGLGAKKAGSTLKLGRKKLVLGKKKVPPPVAVPTAKKVKGQSKAKKVQPPKKAPKPVAVTPKAKPKKEPVVKKKPKKVQPVEESRTSKRNRLKKELNKFNAWRERLPLKIGIADELFSRFSPAFSKKIIRLVVYQHTRGAQYLKNVALGNKRFSLIGEVTGSIERKEKDFSYKALNKKSVGAG